MSFSICYKCGSPKKGLLNPCPKCGVAPSADNETAISLILSTHINNKEDLLAYSDEIGRNTFIPDPSEISLALFTLKDPVYLKNIEDESNKFKLDNAAMATSSLLEKDISSYAKEIKSLLLDKNSFAILGATTRDNRKTIVELAEEMSLNIDHELCSRARAELTNPRKRLNCEISWFPGLSPKRIEEFRKTLQTDYQKVLNLDAIPYLAHANLLMSAIEMMDPSVSKSVLSRAIINLAHAVEEIDTDDTLRDINEDRTISGFTAIQSEADVADAITERRRLYRNTIKNTLNLLPTDVLIDVVTEIANETTSNGENHAPLLVDELIDSYESEAQNYMTSEAENIQKLIEKTREVAEKDGSLEADVEIITKRIAELVTEWDAVAQPIQLSMKARGLKHDLSSDLAYQIRQLGIDLFNDYGFLDIANELTNTLLEVFAELPDVVERLGEDQDTIEDFFKQRDNANEEAEQWARDITYEAEVGIVFKDKLRISPDGVQWRNKTYPLNTITHARWGGVAHSINGIPSGTTYTIVFGDKNTESEVELKNSTTYQSFIEKFWRAVGMNLLTQMANDLKGGKHLYMGDAEIDDDGVMLTKHKFLGNEKVYCKWSEATVSTGQGYFNVHSENDKKVYSQMSYIEVPNVHIFEALIRMSFKSWTGRISGVLDS